MTPPPPPRHDDETDSPGADSPVTPLGEALSSFVRSRGLQAGSGLARIEQAWEEAVGPALARHARPVLLRGDELVCEVDEAAWATQVRLHALQILDRLAEQAGQRLASQLSVRVGRRPTGR